MFLIGEKVRVRSLDELKVNYEFEEDETISVDGIDFILDRQDFCEKEVTIKEIIFDKSSGVYGIEEDNDGFWWSGEMFKNT